MSVADELVLPLENRWLVLLPATSDDIVLRFLGISLGLGDLFEDDEVCERAWLNQPRHYLGGASAIDLLLSGEGDKVSQVEGLLDEQRNLR